MPTLVVAEAHPRALWPQRWRWCNRLWQRHELLAEGVYLAPSAYEAGFVSAAHSDADIEDTLAAVRRALARV